MGWLSKIFGKKKKVKFERSLAEVFHTTKDDDYNDPFVKKWIEQRTAKPNTNIMVNPDLAFGESAYKKIKELENKVLQVNPEDYKNLVFDEEIDLNNYNLSDLTQKTKQKIVKLIIMDTELRLGRRAKTVFHDDGSFTTPNGFTYTPQKEEENE